MGWVHPAPWGACSILWQRFSKQLVLSEAILQEKNNYLWIKPSNRDTSGVIKVGGREELRGMLLGKKWVFYTPIHPLRWMNPFSHSSERELWSAFPQPLPGWRSKAGSVQRAYLATSGTDVWRPLSRPLFPPSRTLLSLWACLLAWMSLLQRCCHSLLPDKPGAEPQWHLVVKYGEARWHPQKPTVYD